MNLLLLAMLTVEHVVVGVAYLAASGVATLLAMWQRSIYRRVDRLTARAR